MTDIIEEHLKEARTIVLKIIARARIRQNEDFYEGVERLVKALFDIARQGGDLNLIYRLFFSDDITDLQESVGSTRQLEMKLKKDFIKEKKRLGNIKKSLNPAMKRIKTLPLLYHVPPGLTQEAIDTVNEKISEIPIILEIYFRLQRERQTPQDDTIKEINDYFTNKRIYDVLSMLIKKGFKRAKAAETLEVVFEYSPTEDAPPDAEAMLKRYDRYKKRLRYKNVISIKKARRKKQQR